MAFRKSGKNGKGTMVMKKSKGRRNKLNVVFDEKARVEFLTGFKKRKDARRRKAIEQELNSLHRQKKEVKRKRKAEEQEQLSEADLILSKIEKNFEGETSKTEYTLPSHTVTVTDLSNVRPKTMLGKNFGPEFENKVREEVRKETANSCKESNPKRKPLTNAQIKTMKQQMKKKGKKKRKNGGKRKFKK